MKSENLLYYFLKVVNTAPKIYLIKMIDLMPVYHSNQSAVFL